MTRDRNDDLQREIQTHLDLEAEDRMADGVPEAAARAAARRAFGSVARVREDARGVWIPHWRDAVAGDVRYTLRTLRRSPGFAAVAILSLALGIGANTAMFSVVHAVVLQPLGYPQPGQLVLLTTRSEGFDRYWVSAPEYVEFLEITRSFAAVGAFRTRETNLAALDRPRRVMAADVNAALLEALALAPARGRWFRQEEIRPGGPALVLLSHELAQSAFAGQEDVLGATLEIDGVRREVVGVMPPGADLMDQGIDVWLPLWMDPSRDAWNRLTHMFHLVGRLEDGVTVAGAEAELEALVATWSERTGATGHVFAPGGHALQMEPLHEAIVGPAGRAIWMLQAAVGLVLIIACANLASLLLARTGARRRELALRAAIGAGRRRLLGQFIAEGLVLSLLGGAAGLAVAWGGVRLLERAYAGSLPRAGEIALDPVVLGFTLVVSLVAGVAFGLVPLAHVPVAGVARALRDAGTSGTTGARQGMRRGLVVAEVAFAVVLVTGAGLMVRTVSNLMRVDAGFERARLAAFGVEPAGATYQAFEDRRRLFDRILGGLAAVPGIERVSIASGLPPQRPFTAAGTEVEDTAVPLEGRPFHVADYYQTVGVDYFATMGVGIVRGRGFEEADRAGAPVAIVNETFARRYWAGRDPIGRRIRSQVGGQTPWTTVVGVARDVKQGGIEQETGTEVYFLLDQVPRIFAAWIMGNWNGSMQVVLRSDLPMHALAREVERVVREADASLPVIQLQPMDARFRETLRRPRMLMQLLGGFAALALLLAAIGTYGVLAYRVSERRRDIGIRLALGATRPAVLRSTMAHGLMLTAAGLAIGLAGAAAVTRLMEGLLFGVRPTDPATLAGVTALIMIVAAVASLVPALRAMRVDPLTALRDE